jgi:1-acyl-sn-glycerol-3-phosphate acyltransferase
MSSRDPKEKTLAEPWYRAAVTVLRPSMALWFNWHAEGVEHVPPKGPLLVACNHISELDPLCQGLFLVRAGRRPRFLAKSDLLENWLLRKVLLGARQIPVYRGTGDRGPVDASVKALGEGECVVIYPEATLTKNPDYSPMQAKRGIARIAFEAGLPVLPLAVWGSHKFMPRRGEKKDRTFGRPIMVKASPPIDLSEFAARGHDDPEALRQATDRVMDELSRLVADLRARYPKRWA